jgi:single-stranded-DNA-specific exonuclease
MSKSCRWLLPEFDRTAAEQLASQLTVDPLVARVLYARGYRDAAIASRFLNPEIEHLHDPFLLRDMEPAAARLQLAIERKQKILLYGDYDVDGTTSVVILKKIIDLAGGLCGFYVPHRVKDGYGMRPEVIERAAADGVALVISVDTGIRATAVVEHARELGIDVIVTDHHLPETSLPPALAVVNPNRSDCLYPEKNLCGAGVAFKLVQALMRKLGWPDNRVRTLTDSLLKMVAVATVADVVPLTGENRVIVKRGLEGFTTVRNLGLRALLRVAGFGEGDRPTSTQVAFRIAPRINAAGRMANASDVIEMFLTGDAERAMVLATQLHDLNKERRETEDDIVKAILEECTRVPVTDDQFAVIFSGKAWHKGVVGICASRVVERFHRPAFVLSEDEETGMTSGSGRSIPAFHLLEALEAMPELFTKFGGHRQAAGLTLPTEKLEEFRRRFNEFAAARLTLDDLRPTIQIDAPFTLNELNDRSVGQVLALAPFGLGNSSPLFSVSGVEVAGPPAAMGEKHLRVPVRQNGRMLMLKAWNFAERAAELQPGSRLDCAICLEEDQYSLQRGYGSWCAILKDVRPATAIAVV